MTGLYLAQLLLPLILIGWMLWLPSRSRLAFPRKTGRYLIVVGGYPRPMLFDGRFPMRGDCIGSP